MRHIFIFTILLVSKASLAQEPAYIQYGVEDGLPSTLVYHVLQDRKGFLWFATDKGLARFDGFRFKVYTMKDGLPDPEILYMFEDSQERLWLSCFQKKPCYFQNGVFHTAENDTLLSKAEIKTGTYTFFEDDDGSIWIAGGEGKLCHYDSESFICHKPYDKTLNVFRKTYLTTRVGNKILALSLSSIFDINDPNVAESIYSCTFPETSYLSSVSTFANQIFYSHENRIIKLSHDSSSFTELIRNYKLPIGKRSICYSEVNSIWLCYTSSKTGAFRIDYNNNFLLPNPINYAEGKQVLNVFRDNENSLWFTTFNEGILSLPNQSAKIYSNTFSSELNSDNITAIYLLPNHELLFGDALGNIYSLSKNEIAAIPLKEDEHTDRIRQIVSTSASGWIAIMDNYIYSKNKGFIAPGYIYKVNAASKIERTIGAPKYIFIDDEKIWLGSNNVLVFWTKALTDINVVLQEKRITAIGKDSNENIWVGGIDGLLSEKDSFSINWGNRFEPLKGRTIDIKQAGLGQLWVATAELGLLRASVQNGAVTGVEIINELIPTPIENIKSLFKEGNGKLWMATNNGVYSIDRDLNTRHFDTSDGLPNNDVNAVAVDRDTLWAATVSGLAKIQVNRPIEKGGFPTYFSGLSYNLNENDYEFDLIYQQEKSITLPPGTSMLEVQLSGLHFNSQGNITYEYIEEEKPLPLQWLTWSNLASNFYSTNDTSIIKRHSRNFGINPPVGTFETKVTAISKNGVRSLHPDTFTFTILPYWYQTIWFSLLAGGVAFFFIWQFYRQATAVKRLQRAATDLQLQAIKAQVNPHYIGNSINAIQQFFYPPNPAKASQYISIFTYILRQTMHLAEVPFIPLKEELDFINKYLEMVQLRFEDRFQYKITGAGKLPPEMPFPAMILQPILENATIHGLATEGVSLIDVDFQLSGKMFVCSVTDNGIGFNVSQKRKKTAGKKRVSKGIKLLKRKVYILNKMYGIKLKLDFQDLSENTPEAHGTRVTVSFVHDKTPKIIADEKKD